jgi:rhamnosyl/mannosyltransferase
MVHLAGTRGVLASAPISGSFVRFVRQHVKEADLVHIHHPNPIADLALMLSPAANKVVVTHHSDIVRQKFLTKLIYPVLNNTWRVASRILVNSTAYLKNSSIPRKFRNKCRVVPLGVDLTPFEENRTAEVVNIRDKYGSRIVLAVGRLVAYKGFEYLIDAMAHVEGKLLIIGKGPLEQRLRQHAIGRGLEKKVDVLTKVVDAVPYFQASTMYVLSSVTRAEAFGLVQVEAMAAGKPVVNTAIDSGVPYVSVDGVTGITVPPRDSASLSDAMNRLFDDPALGEKLGKAGRERAREEFSSRRMIERTLEIYEAVIKG